MYLVPECSLSVELTLNFLICTICIQIVKKLYFRSTSRFITENCEHGLRGLAEGLYFDHGSVINRHFLEGQGVHLARLGHVNQLARVQALVVLVPGHLNLVMGKFNLELCCLTLLHGHILDGLDKLKTNAWQGSNSMMLILKDKLSYIKTIYIFYIHIYMPFGCHVTTSITSYLG